MNRIEPISCFDEKAHATHESKLKIIFRDGITKDYNTELLVKFLDMREITKTGMPCSLDMSKQTFELIVTLLNDNATFTETKCIKDYIRFDLGFLQNLEKNILMLCGGQGQAMLLKALKMIPWSYNKAFFIVEAYEEQKKENKEFDGTESMTIKFLEEILRGSIYFKSLKDYKISHFEPIRKCQKEITEGKKILYILNRQMEEFTQQVKPVPEIYQKVIDLAKNQISCFSKQLAEKWNSLKLDPSNHIRNLRISKLLDSVDPQIRKLARIAKRYFMIHREYILNTLQYQKPNPGYVQMRNRELIKHLTGEKNALFDAYGLTRYCYDEESSFAHSEVATTNFIYMLDNGSPKELEDEIRRDLETFGRLKLGPRIIPENIVEEMVMAVEEEVYKPEDKPLFDKLLHWRTISDIETVEVKKELIKKWKWDQSGINILPSELRIAMLPEGMPAGSVTRFKGILNKFGKTYDICFEISNFDVIILNPEVDPDAESSYEFLVQMSKNYKNQPVVFPQMRCGIK